MKWIPIAAGAVMFIGLMLMVIAAIMLSRARKSAGPAPARPAKGSGTGPMSMPPPPPPYGAEPMAAEPTVQMSMAGMMPGADGRTVVEAPVPKMLGRLVCISGPLEGREMQIDEAGFTIGRDQTQAQLVITDPRVSKKHVWIGLRNGEVWAVDKGSTNGTYLNKPGANRITEEMLNDGDVIIVSEDVARFQFRKG